MISVPDSVSEFGCASRAASAAVLVEYMWTRDCVRISMSQFRPNVHTHPIRKTISYTMFNFYRHLAAQSHACSKELTCLSQIGITGGG